MIYENGERVTFADERFYHFDGKFYPSVTWVLHSGMPVDEFLIDWYKNMGANADIIARKAADEGSLTHWAIEHFTAGDTVELPAPGDKIHAGTEVMEAPFIVWRMFVKYVDFYQKVNPIIEAIELRLASEKVGAGGTLDNISTINGQRWLIDYKTSNYTSEKMFVQLVAYKRMYEEKTGKKIDRVGILHLKAKTRGEDKKGKSIQGKGWRLLEPSKPIEYYYGIWENSKSLFYFMNPNPTPKNLIYKTKFQKDERKEFDLPDEAAE